MIYLLAYLRMSLFVSYRSETT